MNKLLDYDELKLERKENYPEAKSSIKATIIAKNFHGLYFDINRTYEGYVSLNELGKKNVSDYNIGDKIDVLVCANQNQEGLFRLSIRELESFANWQKLEELKDQNLELKITKIVKSGVEAEILVTGQTGFIPSRYLDNHYGSLKDKKESEWVGLNVPGKIQELDQSKNKIILNSRIITDEIKKAKAEEVLKQLSVGQSIEGEVVRCTDFGVFVDIGGIDALIPASELSWRRFKKPSDIVKPGQKIKAKIFRVELEERKIGLSVKQEVPDPWTTLPENLKVGGEVKGKVVTHAEFGVFVEVMPGIEALLHKSNMKEGDFPKIGEEVVAEITNFDSAKKRMGIAIKDSSSNETKPEAKAESREENPVAEKASEEKHTETEENKSESNDSNKENGDSERKELEYAK